MGPVPSGQGRRTGCGGLFFSGMGDVMDVIRVAGRVRACLPSVAMVVLMALSSAHAHDPAPDHAHRDGSTPASRAQRLRLLTEGEAALRAGEVDKAQAAFDQAALMTHDADTELGLLRTQMQAGAYRQALAFAAHTAGVHLDEPDGAVFYAWLLNWGGHVALAEQTLQQAERRMPDAVRGQGAQTLHALRKQWAAGSMWPAAGEPVQPGASSDTASHGLLRLFPYATGAVTPPAAVVCASATLLADGRHALVPLAAVDAPSGSEPSTHAIWLRNGLGHTVAARVRQREADWGVALLSLDDPLPVPPRTVAPARDAFAGSPVYALDAVAAPQGQPAWPVMRAGFLGMAMASGAQRLGAELPGAGPRGGPAYDAGGRLIGMVRGALMGASSGDVLIPIGALRARFGALAADPAGARFGPPDSAPRPAPMGADEVYERAMKTTLQVLALPR